MADRYQGRVALVTGGGNGIGAATSRRLADEGASVVVTDYDADAAGRVAAGLGDRGLGLRCDVTDPAAVEAAVAQTVARFDRLDVLVCCAGILRDNLVHRMSDDDWSAVIATHLTGTFLCTRAAQVQMVPNRYGRMVVLSSTSALGNRGQANYSAAKAGLQGLARTLAIELGPFGITVNAVAPGFVETAMTRATADRMRVDFEEFKAARAAEIPVRRIGQPEDIAGAIAYLASEEAGFVSGQTLYVRGGP